MTSGPFHYATNKGLVGFDHQSQGEWRGAFYFIQGADPQLGLINDYIEQKPETPDWRKEIELTNKAVAAANAMSPRPKFFIVCGDLVHAFPGEANRVGQEKDLKECFSKLNPEIPLVCVCGNHDVGQTPTHESMNIYRKSFGDDYFSFWVQGVKCIALNSQFYVDDSEVADLRVEMDEWLDRELEDLKSRPCKHVIVFQHVALFLSDENEPDQYFNISSPTRKVLMDKFKSAGVEFVFCGHYHRNAGGKSGRLNSVVTSAIGGQLGDDQSGFRLVKVFDDVITHKYFSLDDVPKTVDLSTAEF